MLTVSGSPLSYPTFSIKDKSTEVKIKLQNLQNDAINTQQKN